MQLCRRVIEALLPPGSLWVPEDGGDFDKLLDGMADNAEATRVFVRQVAKIRSPKETPVLDDLEREFGIVPDTGLSEAVRRQRLLSVKTARNSTGTADFVQNALRKAGFDVYVHANGPPVDPANIISFGNATVTGNENALFGKDGAQFAGSVGDLLVNGMIYENGVQITYAIPPAEYWPLVFFVGGAATRDVDGSILSVATATIDILRRNELNSLIVKLKPMISWCGLNVRYVVDAPLPEV